VYRIKPVKTLASKFLVVCK